MENLNPRERRRRKDRTGTHGKRVGSDTLTLAHLSLFPDIILPRRLVHAIVEIVGQVGARLPPRFLFERVEVERRDVVGLEPDEEVDLRGVETFKPMRFGEVGEEGVFQVLRGQVLLRGEISKRKPCTAWLPG